MALPDLPAATAAGTAGRPLAALRDEPRFRLLFASQVLSILGDRVTFVVLPFAVLAVGGDVGDVGLVSAAQFLPFALVSLPAGVLADRFDRRRILVISDVVRLCCQLTSGVLLVSRAATVVSLAALAFLFGLADATTTSRAPARSRSAASSRVCPARGSACSPPWSP